MAKKKQDNFAMLPSVQFVRKQVGLLFALTVTSIASPTSHAAEDTWVYLYPGFSWLTAEQSSGSQAPSSFTASTIKSAGMRAGKAFDAWTVEGNFEFDQFSVDTQNDGTPTTLAYRGHRFNLDVLRRAFSELGPYKITGYGRLGLGSFTMPLLDGEGSAELARVTQTTLNLGFSAATYVASRTRLTASIRWMPALGTSNSTPVGRADLKGGFNFAFTGGVQHLFPSQWSLGFLGSWQSAQASGVLAANDGTLGSGDLSSTLGSLQVQVGYQF